MNQEKNEQGTVNKSVIDVMSPITQKLDALLNAEGFSLVDAWGSIGGYNKGNNLEYKNMEGESVYINIRESTMEVKP